MLRVFLLATYAKTGRLEIGFVWRGVGDEASAGGAGMSVGLGSGRLGGPFDCAALRSGWRRQLGLFGFVFGGRL